MTASYGIEHEAPAYGPPRFRWRDAGHRQGEWRSTASEAHADAMQGGLGHEVGLDLLLGADLWGSYLHACGVLDMRPVPTAGNITMRAMCLAAGTRLCARAVGSFAPNATGLQRRAA